MKPRKPLGEDASVILGFSDVGEGKDLEITEPDASEAGSADNDASYTESGAFRENGKEAVAVFGDIPSGAAFSRKDIAFSPENPHAGHRLRMKERFRRFGRDFFDTYELLEMLLYYAIPQRDTNPLAKRLLAECGGIGGVLSRGAEELIKVSGVGASLADYLASLALLDTDALGRVFNLRSIDDIGYREAGIIMMTNFASVNKPAFCSCFLDNSLNVISSQVKNGIYLSSAGVKPELVTKGITRHNAAVVITATNNPYGGVIPSLYDEESVRMLRQATNEVGASYANHFIVSGNEFRGTGRSDPIISHNLEAEDFALTLAKPAEQGEDDPAAVIAAALSPPCGKVDCQLVRRQLIIHKTCAGLFNESFFNLEMLFDENTAFLIKIICALIARAAFQDVIGRQMPVGAELRSFCCRLFLGLSEENVYAVLLDAEDRVISCERVGDGTASRMELFPRTVVDIASAVRAKGVVLIHNHPMGNSAPSDTDVVMTEKLGRILDSCGIELKAHYVVGDAEVGKVQLPSCENDR